MNFILVVALLLVLSTVAVGIKSAISTSKTSSVKTFLGMNIFTFFAIMIGAAVFMLSGGSVSAAEPVEALASSSEGLKYIAAALSTGLACVGCGIAVAISGSAAIGAISENEKLLGKTIIFVGLAEGIAIYGLIISIMILGN